MGSMTVCFFFDEDSEEGSEQNSEMCTHLFSVIELLFKTFQEMVKRNIYEIPLN